MLPATIVSVQPPQMPRVSSRSNKGQTTRYDDFVQQINLKSGNYATDGIRLFRLEETNNMSSMSCTNQKQNTQLAWSLDAAYVQQLNGERNYWYMDTATKQRHMMTDQQSYPGVHNNWYRNQATLRMCTVLPVGS